ncbi:MAG: hypothetical protein QME73_14480 [Bacillota bacterium]|nr:hypothetical protein [Bacillota bacterium]
MRNRKPAQSRPQNLVFLGSLFNKENNRQPRERTKHEYNSIDSNHVIGVCSKMTHSHYLGHLPTTRSSTNNTGNIILEITMLLSKEFFTVHGVEPGIKFCIHHSIDSFHLLRGKSAFAQRRDNHPIFLLSMAKTISSHDYPYGLVY